MIRLAQQTDADQLAALNLEFNDSDVSAQQAADGLDRSPNSEVTIVAEIDGELVGFACLQIYRSWCYTEPWAELTELFVRPEHRRSRLGRAMVCFAETSARDHGATEIVLLVNKRNAAGQSLYRDCGYSEQDHLSFHKRLES